MSKKWVVKDISWSIPILHNKYNFSSINCFLKVWDTNRLKPADVFILDGKIYQHHMSPTANQHSLVACKHIKLIYQLT